MSDQTTGSLGGSAGESLRLPDNPNLDWLRKRAKERLDELRASDPRARLADAQRDIARRYGFPSWRALKARIETMTVEGRLFAAASSGDVTTLGTLLDEHPDKLRIRADPYGHTLLHAAAHQGRVAAVRLLLDRGSDPNVREHGDDTYPMHWAAAAGHVEVVRLLAEAGGDVIGAGDDHELSVIGWATCWDGCDDDAHRAVVKELEARGARHHIFSAIAMNLGAEVRHIVAADPSALNRRMSRNENNRLPLQFAVRMNRPAMIDLLLELGADPLGADSDGLVTAAYATNKYIDRRVMERIHAMAVAEIESADRGNRPARGTALDLAAALTLGEWTTAERLVKDNTQVLAPAGGALHLMAKRDDQAAAKWLLDHGASPDGLWAHWDANVTPLHLAVMENHIETVRLLIAAKADPTIRDSKHDSDAIGWAEFFQRPEMVALLRKAASKT